MEEKEKYLKRIGEKEINQTYVRLRFSDNGDFTNSEMLIVGRYLGATTTETINNFKYDKLSKDGQQVYRRHWDASRSWMTEIEQDEFNRAYRKFSDRVFDAEAKEFEGQSILKLDRNFHVYIHGDKSLMETGVDEKGNFVKLYYTNIF